MNYFSDDELECKHCGELNLAKGFRDKLNQLRVAVGHAMNITSACRCKVHNTAIGGKDSSFHLTSHPWGCCAADIATTNWTSQQRWQFVHKAMELGWSIGINWQKNFIHIDRRTDYNTGWEEPVLFPY
jgi:hypothetical protein